MYVLLFMNSHLILFAHNLANFCKRKMPKLIPNIVFSGIHSQTFKLKRNFFSPLKTIFWFFCLVYSKTSPVWSREVVKTEQQNFARNFSAFLVSIELKSSSNVNKLFTMISNTVFL